MEQVTMQDIQSEGEHASDQAESCPFSKKSKLRTMRNKDQKNKASEGYSNLENMKTPLQHYQTLRKQRETFSV
jgi:hypothetical protein